MSFSSVMSLQLVIESKIKNSHPLKNVKDSATPGQLKWLARGLSQAGGKLPLFDENGRRISQRTVISCLEKGWAKPWFENPIKLDWQVCALTKTGRGLFFDT